MNGVWMASVGIPNNWMPCEVQMPTMLNRPTEQICDGYLERDAREIYRNCRGGRERHADGNIYHRRGYYKQYGFDSKHADYNSHRRGGAARAGNEGAHIDFGQLVVVDNGDN